jgi:hypothetical protein
MCLELKVYLGLGNISLILSVMQIEIWIQFKFQEECLLRNDTYIALCLLLLSAFSYLEYNFCPPSKISFLCIIPSHGVLIHHIYFLP